MSSILPNQIALANLVNYTAAQPATQAQSTSSAASTTGTQPATVSLDNYQGQSTSTGADILSSSPPVATETRPVNYTTNLQSAQQNLSAFSTSGGGSPTEVALLAAENQASSKKTSDIGSRETKTNNQAKSIVESAETSHKQHCKTKHDNHDDNVSKMKKLGFTPKQAEAMARTLEDRRTPADAKNKLAYQLAAIGMCGASGTGLTKATANNVADIKNGLAKFADHQAKNLASAIPRDSLVFASTNKGLNKLVAPDVSSTSNPTTLATNASDTASLPVQSALSSMTTNASAITSAALNRAYPNLTTI